MQLCNNRCRVRLGDKMPVQATDVAQFTVLSKVFASRIVDLDSIATNCKEQARTRACVRDLRS